MTNYLEIFMFSIKTAIRFIANNKLQSALIILGIAVGVAVQIFVGILIDSLQSSLVDQTIGSSPQVTIVKEKDRVSNYSEIIKQSKEIPGVRVSQSAVSGNAILVKDSENYPVLLRGLDIKQDDIYGFSERLQKGVLPVDKNEVLIGFDLEKKSGLSIGDQISLTKADGTSGIFKISGVYDLGNASINSGWLIANISGVQDFFVYGDSVSSIEIQVKDVFKADLVADELNNLQVVNGLTVSDWKKENESLLTALQSQSTSSYMIQIFVLLSVVIAIASILAITVNQKSRQIGILKAMGLKDRATSSLFIFQGSILGFFGVAVGMALGLLLFWSFNTFAKNPDGSSIVTANYRWSYITATGAIAFASSILAGLMPAIKSSKLNPIDIIRNN